MSLAVTISPPEAAEAGCAVAVNPTAFSYHGANSVNWATATGYGLTPTIPEGAKLLSYDIVMRVTEVDPYSGERTTEDITVTWEDKVLPIELPTAVCDLWSVSTQDERDSMPWMFILAKEDIGDRYRYDDRKNRPYGILVETEYEYTGSGSTPLGGPRYQKVETVSVTANFELSKSHVKFVIKTPNGYTGTHPFDWADKTWYLDETNGWQINGTKFSHTQREVELDLPRGEPVDVIAYSWAPGEGCPLFANIAFLDYGSEFESVIPALERLVVHGARPYWYHFSFTPTAAVHVFELWFTVKFSWEITSNIGVFFAADAYEYRLDESEYYAELRWRRYSYNHLRAPETVSSLTYEGMTASTIYVNSDETWKIVGSLPDPNPPPIMIDSGAHVIAVPIRTKHQSNRIRMTVRRNGYNLISQGTYPSVDKSAWTFSHWDIAIPNADGTVRHERVTDLTLDWWVPMFGLEFAEPVTLRIQAVYTRPGSILYTPTSGRILHGRSGTILYLD